MYAELSKVNYFKHRFNLKDKDSIGLDATVSGIAKVTVEGLKLDYTFTERPTTKYYYISLGGKLGIDKELSQGIWSLEATVNNANKESYSGGIITVGGQRFFVVGYSMGVFKVRK